MGIDVVACCRIHGRDIEIFRIGKRKFCASCVSSFLARQGYEINMVTIDSEPKPKPHRGIVHVDKVPSHICQQCSLVWNSSRGTSCPKCGTAV